MMYQSFENTILRGDDVDEDLRLLLIGKTGSGKSSTGNIIFNDRVFQSEMSSSSVTRICQTHTDAINNRRVTVIDTPDFIFSTYTEFDADSELKKSLGVCSPGAHVILLLLPLSTFTVQEKDFIAWFEQKFGAEALRFTLVLFTHADQRHMRTLGEMIMGNAQLSGFIDRCGQRYHEFNIKHQSNRQQVTELMEKINRLMTENRNSCYTLEMMEENERRGREKERREEEEREREYQITIERVREETEKRVKREYEQEKLENQEQARGEEVEIKEREHQITLEGVRIETEKKISAECDVEQSSLPKTFWNKPNCIYKAVTAVVIGAVIGGTVIGGAVIGGAVIGGAVIGAVVGGTVGRALKGAGGGVISNKAKGGAHSGAESTSSLMNTEEAQSNKLSRGLE